jgi:hypothetical protein
VDPRAGLEDVEKRKANRYTDSSIFRVKERNQKIFFIH